MPYGTQASIPTRVHISSWHGRRCAAGTRKSARLQAPDGQSPDATSKMTGSAATNFAPSSRVTGWRSVWSPQVAPQTSTRAGSRAASMIVGPHAAMPMADARATRAHPFKVSQRG